MRDVRQLSELLLASGDLAAAALRQYGEQRAERLRRMRRVSKTLATLMTIFTDAGRARRDRYYAASSAGQAGLPIAAGQRYLWRLKIDGEGRDDWTEEFVVLSQDALAGQ